MKRTREQKRAALLAQVEQVDLPVKMRIIAS